MTTVHVLDVNFKELAAQFEEAVVAPGFVPPTPTPHPREVPLTHAPFEQAFRSALAARGWARVGPSLVRCPENRVVELSNAVVIELARTR